MAIPLPGKTAGPITGKKWWWWALTGVTVIVGLLMTALPLANSIVVHTIDRFKNGKQKDAELERLSKVYSVQVGKQLGINPANVTGRDLLMAAQINPQLGRLVQETKRREGNDNRFSMLTSAGAAIPFVGPTGKAMIDASKAAKVVASVGGGLGGGALAALMGKDKVDPHDVAEAIHGQMVAAREQGADPRRAISPQLVFMLRVSQDQAFGNAIKSTFGKDFHKMNEGEQASVMQHYPGLAGASQSEAYAVATGMLPVEELVATAPNMNGMAVKYASAATTAKPQSHAARIEAERRQAQASRSGPSV